MSPCIYFNFVGSIPFVIAVALAIENNPQSFKLHCFWHSTILMLSQQNKFVGKGQHKATILILT